MSKYVWVLLFPVLQSLILAPNSLAQIIIVYGLNIFCFIIFVLWAIIRYRKFLYLDDDKYFYWQKGVFIRRFSKISNQDIHSVIIEKKYPSALFGAREIRLLVPSKYKNVSQIHLFLSKDKIINTIQEIYGGRSKIQLYKTNNLRLLLMALSWSNSLTGLLILAPFIKNIGDLFGEKYSQLLYKNLDISSYIVYIGVPPLAAFIAGFLIVGWAAAFFIQFIRYYNFTTEKSDKEIFISRGWINKHLFIIQKEKINSITVKQSLLMQLLKLHSIYLHTINTGTQKGDRSLLVPGEKANIADKVLKEFVNLNCSCKREVKPNKDAIIGYVMAPGICIILLVSVFILFRVINFFSSIVQIFWMFCMIILVVWLVFRYIAFKNSSLVVTDKAVLINYFSMMTLTRNIISYDKLQFVEISQNFMQKKSGNCNFKVYIYSVKKSGFSVSDINFNKASELIREIEGYMNKKSPQA